MRYLEELGDVHVKDVPRIFREEGRFYREGVIGEGRFYRQAAFDYFIIELNQVTQLREFILYSAFRVGLE